jgi:hypothetical protein
VPTSTWRPGEQAEAFGFGAAVLHQLAPGLALGLRQAGRARGEQDGGDVVGGDLRHRKFGFCRFFGRRP